MIFTPYLGWCEIEPITEDGIISSDDKKTIEGGRVIFDTTGWAKAGDIISFREHGFFETIKWEGKIHYVVRVSDEIILGKLSNE